MCARHPNDAQTSFTLPNPKSLALTCCHSTGVTYSVLRLSNAGYVRFRILVAVVTLIAEQNVGKEISIFTAILSKKPAVVFGIQLPCDAWQNYKNKCFTIPLDLDDEDDPICYGMEQVAKAKFRLEELCEPIWPAVEIVRACLEEDGRFQLLGLVASTRRNYHLIPQDGVLEKLKEVLGNEGFHGKSGWFFMAK